MKTTKATPVSDRGQEKRCTKCGAVKALEEFYRMSSSPDGYQYTCKKCQSRRNKTPAARATMKRYREVHSVENSLYQKRYEKRNSARLAVRRR